MASQDCLPNGDKNRCRKDEKKKVKEKIGFPNDLIIPNEGKSDEISLLLVRDLNVVIKSFLGSHVDAIVTDQSSDLKRRLTKFYGSPYTSLRRESWDLLQFLNSQYQMP